jgi:hypothetical protein
VCPQDWNTCQSLLARLCPEERLAGLPCMNCVERFREEVRDAYKHTHAHAQCGL